MAELVLLAVGAQESKGVVAEPPRHLVAVQTMWNQGEIPDLMDTITFDSGSHPPDPRKSGHGRPAVPSRGDDVRGVSDLLRDCTPWSGLGPQTEEVLEILKSSRSKDLILQHLLKNPERVQNWLEAGKPGNKNLILEVSGN